MYSAVVERHLQGYADGQFSCCIVIKIIRELIGPGWDFTQYRAGFFSSIGNKIDTCGGNCVDTVLRDCLLEATATGSKSCEHGANVAHIGFRCAAVCIEKQLHFRRHFPSLHQLDGWNAQAFLKDFCIDR
ncbi:hypothetical protein D3C80_1511680 [compost metagenome]